MKTILSLIVLIALIFSCKSNRSDEKVTTEQNKTPVKITLSGKGNKIEAINLNSGKAIFDITINSNDYHSVWLTDENGKKMELLTDGSDVYNSQKIINIRKSGNYYLQVIAKTKWNIDITN